MENSPTDIDSSQELSEDKKESKKDKKPAKAKRLVGLFAMQPEAQAVKEPAEKVETPKPAKEEELGELAELKPEEKQFIERELVWATQEDETGRAEAETDGPESKVVEFRQRVAGGEDSDEVFSDIMEELQDPLGVEIEESLPIEVEPGLREFTDEGEISLNPETASTATESEVAEEAEVEEGLPTGGSRGGGGRRVPPTARGGASGGGSSGGSERPPRRLSYHQAMPAIFGGAMYNRDIVPLSIALQAEAYPDYSNPKTAALVSGVMGYLIGRRRGRIKAEKQLLPVQQKLQKEVLDLQWQLQTKEMKIRQAARESTELKEVAKFERHPAPEAKLQPEKLPPKPEAKPLPKHNSEGHLWHVGVTAQAKPLEAAPAPPETTKSEKLVDKKEKHFQTLNRQELLRVSETVFVEGTTLREIYENHLVGERGLRRLVGEYFEGGDIKRALRREIVEREIDFERDPIMRNQPAAPASYTSSAPTKNDSLQTLLKKADASVFADSRDEELAYYRARGEYESKQQSQQQRRQRLLDISMSATITLLIVLVLYVLIAHP